MAMVFLYDNTIQSRLEGVGVLSMNDAMDMGCVGPMARASGLPVDYRMAEDEGFYKSSISILSLKPPATAWPG